MVIPSTSLILTGFMGTGKTTLGRLLAQQWGVPFLDTDREIECRLGQTISEIFRTRGEPFFRKWEYRLACELASLQGWIIATGGGFFVQPKIREICCSHTIVVLWASPEEIRRRLGSAPSRPLLQNWDLEELYHTRKPTYLSFPYHLNTEGRPLEELVEEVSQIWQSSITLK